VEARGSVRGAGFETRGVRVDNSAGMYNAVDRERLPAEPHKYLKLAFRYHTMHRRPRLKFSPELDIKYYA